QAAGGEDAIGQSGNLHGRQGRRGRTDRQDHQRSRIAAIADGRAETGWRCNFRNRGSSGMVMVELTNAPDAQVGAQIEKFSDFSSLLNKEFKPKSGRAKAEVENAVQTLAEYVLKDASIVSEDAIHSIEAIIAQIDK